MNDNSNSLVLQIAQVLENHGTAEIGKAISILRKYQTTSELLTDLAAPAKPAASTGREKGPAVEKRSKPPDRTTSKAVRDLEKSDPVKHRRLLEFDNLLRQGRVLETNGSVRRFGELISKDFRSRASRKDNISALMSTLAQLEGEELNKALGQAMESSYASKSDEYQKLAQYLISGN